MPVGSRALPPAQALRHSSTGERLKIVQKVSPNRGPRRNSARPDLVVLHYTGMASADAALARLCDPAAQVSAHYLVSESGAVWQLVPEAERAWHAGIGRWGNVIDVNSHSIGIELANPGPSMDCPPFPQPQIAVLETLLDMVRERWSIPPARVIAHSDAAPGRKIDPGRKFDWRRLASGKRAVWLEPAPSLARLAMPCWQDFQTAAARFGYAAPTGDWWPVLEAFRLRFRPHVAGGALQAVDVALMQALAQAHPCVDAVVPDA